MPDFPLPSTKKLHPLSVRVAEINGCPYLFNQKFYVNVIVSNLSTFLIHLIYRLTVKIILPRLLKFWIQIIQLVQSLFDEIQIIFLLLLHFSI